MATISQVRGMLLEEAILYFLSNSGYQTVEEPGPDGTLQRGPSGIEVIGRGDAHQIDAIADYDETPLFSYPIRLLIEAKCYTRPLVDLPIVRNAVGVLKDVSEYWVTRRGKGTTSRSGYDISKPRYHYQYAIFSTSGFTDNAQRYAFAHDIYLFPLENSAYFKPVAEILLQELRSEQFGVDWRENLPGIVLSELRRSVRNYLRLRSQQDEQEVMGQLPTEAIAAMKQFFNACWRIQVGFIAMLGVQFPVFLVPNPDVPLDELSDLRRAEIRWNRQENGWYIQTRKRQKAFSLDLPVDSFEQYSEWHSPEYPRQDRNSIQVTLTRIDQPRKAFSFDLREGWEDHILDSEHAASRSYEEDDDGIE